MRSAITAIQAGAPQVAIKQLEGYAKNTRTEHHKSGDYRNPDDRSGLPKELTGEILDAYKHMSKEQQAQMRDAITAAKAANPEAWGAKINLPK